MYKRRFYYFDRFTPPVIWEAGDPEDSLIEDIDRLDLEMQALGKDSAKDEEWMRLGAERSNILQMLETMLRARLAESGSKYFDDSMY